MQEVVAAATTVTNMVATLQNKRLANHNPLINKAAWFTGGDSVASGNNINVQNRENSGDNIAVQSGEDYDDGNSAEQETSQSQESDSNDDNGGDEQRQLTRR